MSVTECVADVELGHWVAGSQNVTQFHVWCLGQSERLNSRSLSRRRDTGSDVDDRPSFASTCQDDFA